VLACGSRVGIRPEVEQGNAWLHKILNAYGAEPVGGVPNPEWGQEVKAVVEHCLAVTPIPTACVPICGNSSTIGLHSTNCPRDIDFMDALSKRSQWKAVQAPPARPRTGQTNNAPSSTEEGMK
jgi:hypothetical protein